MWRNIVIGAAGAIMAVAVLAIVETIYGSLGKALGPPTPSGAVLAFDRPEGCPTGWSDFTDGQSLMIVGATFGSEDSAPGLAEPWTMTLRMADLPETRSNIILSSRFA